jgi:hypothetical protein
MVVARVADAEELPSGANASPSSKASAQQAPNIQQGLLTTTEGFDIEYALSFGFDTCGDTSYGQSYRQAIIAKVEGCRFTEAAKKRFYLNAINASNYALSDLIEYVGKNSSMPVRMWSGKLCSEVFAQPAAIAFKKKLNQFKQGKISLSEFTHCCPAKLF